MLLAFRPWFRGGSAERGPDAASKRTSESCASFVIVAAKDSPTIITAVTEGLQVDRIVCLDFLCTVKCAHFSSAVA